MKRSRSRRRSSSRRRNKERSRSRLRSPINFSREEKLLSRGRENRRRNSSKDRKFSRSRSRGGDREKHIQNRYKSKSKEEWSRSPERKRFRLKCHEKRRSRSRSRSKSLKRQKGQRNSCRKRSRSYSSQRIYRRYSNEYRDTKHVSNSRSRGRKSRSPKVNIDILQQRDNKNTKTVDSRRCKSTSRSSDFGVKYISKNNPLVCPKEKSRKRTTSDNNYDDEITVDEDKSPEWANIMKFESRSNSVSKLSSDSYKIVNQNNNNINNNIDGGHLSSNNNNNHNDIDHKKNNDVVIGNVSNDNSDDVCNTNSDADSRIKATKDMDEVSRKLLKKQKKKEKKERKKLKKEKKKLRKLKKKGKEKMKGAMTKEEWERCERQKKVSVLPDIDNKKQLYQDNQRKSKEEFHWVLSGSPPPPHVRAAYKTFRGPQGFT